MSAHVAQVQVFRRTPVNNALNEIFPTLAMWFLVYGMIVLAGIEVIIWAYNNRSGNENQANQRGRRGSHVHFRRP
jgi:hypothetical protein